MPVLLRRVLIVTAIASLPMAAIARGEKVKLGPVKGATYRGIVHDEDIGIKVSRNGKSATATLPSAPAFCSGGSGPEKQSSKGGAISKSDELTIKIAYSSTIGSHAKFATVTINGHFYTFGSATPVFQGTVKTSFVAAGSKSCDGQESFQATKA